MNACKKLLLATLLTNLPVTLIGMEHKERNLARITKSGYLAKLTEGVDEDMTLDNYRIDRMATDLTPSRGELYPGLALEILAGCDTNVLFADNANIDFIELCVALIPSLESRHANRTDESRVKRFLKKAVAANEVDIADIKTIALPPSHIALHNTVLYQLLDQIAASDSESETEDIPDEVVAADTSNTQPQEYTGPEKPVTKRISQEHVQVKHQEPALLVSDHEHNQKTKSIIPAIKAYKIIMPVVGICVVAALVYQWHSKKTKSMQAEVDPDNEQAE
jgi:hypothetical protein